MDNIMLRHHEERKFQCHCEEPEGRRSNLLKTGLPRSLWSLAMTWLLLAGCASMNTGSNDGQVQSYPAPAIEAQWIRDGQPIEYDAFKWYPANDYEVLQDSEVFRIGDYKGVQIFVEKIAVKPYERIYTKFEKNKFRYWERSNND